MAAFIEAPSVRELFEQADMQYSRARFGRVITAMVTPFDVETGALNPKGAQELASFLAANGSEGLVLSGTTGESPTLTRAEEIDLFSSVREAVDLPILAGTGSNNTAEAVSTTKKVTELKLADGFLVVNPYYNKPPQEGILDYFIRVASSTDLPIIVYNIPGRTGGDGILPETLLKLAEVDNIIGLKDASGNPETTSMLAKELPEDFMIYSGDDSNNLNLVLQARSVGAISVASHWAGNEMKAMYEALNDGNIEKAISLDQIMQQSYEYESTADAPNPIPTKAMMRIMGLPVGYSRSPMVLRDYRFIEARAREVIQNLHNATQ